MKNNIKLYILILSITRLAYSCNYDEESTFDLESRREERIYFFKCFLKENRKCLEQCKFQKDKKSCEKQCNDQFKKHFEQYEILKMKDSNQ